MHPAKARCHELEGLIVVVDRRLATGHVVQCVLEQRIPTAWRIASVRAAVLPQFLTTQASRRSDLDATRHRRATIAADVVDLLRHDIGEVAAELDRSSRGKVVGSLHRRRERVALAAADVPLVLYLQPASR